MLPGTMLIHPLGWGGGARASEETLRGLLEFCTLSVSIAPP